MQDRVNHVFRILRGNGPRGKSEAVSEFFHEILKLDGIEVMPVREIGPLGEGPAAAIRHADLSWRKLIAFLRERLLVALWGRYPPDFLGHLEHFRVAESFGGEVLERDFSLEGRNRHVEWDAALDIV